MYIEREKDFNRKWTRLLIMFIISFSIKCLLLFTMN